MGLNAYLEITNMLVGVNRSKIDSFTELCSKLERRGFEINEDTSSVTIDDVAKDNYIVYKQRIRGLFESHSLHTHNSENQNSGLNKLDLLKPKENNILNLDSYLKWGFFVKNLNNIFKTRTF